MSRLPWTRFDDTTRTLGGSFEGLDASSFASQSRKPALRQIHLTSPRLITYTISRIFIIHFFRVCLPLLLLLLLLLEREREREMFCGWLKRKRKSIPREFKSLPISFSSSSSFPAFQVLRLDRFLRHILELSGKNSSSPRDIDFSHEGSFVSSKRYLI